MVEESIKPVRFFCACKNKIDLQTMGPLAIFKFEGTNYYLFAMVTSEKELIHFKVKDVVFAEVEFPDPKNLTAKGQPRLIRWLDLDEELKPKT